MKKTLFTILLGAFGVMVLAAPALAATSVSLSPASVNAVSGKSFNVAIAVNPQGVNNYTEKIELTYPADILEARSFSFGSGWMALSQTGYDLINNTSGVLIKTAGYPGGLSSSATFGTVSFYAKKAGSGTIKLGNGSLALDANNQNVLSGASGSVSVTVTAPKPAPSASPTPIAPPAVSSPTPAPSLEPTSEGSPQATPLAPSGVEGTPTPSAPTQQPPRQSLFLAAISSIITLGTGSIWVSLLILLIIGGIIYYFIRKERRKNLK